MIHIKASQERGARPWSCLDTNQVCLPRWCIQTGPTTGKLMFALLLHCPSPPLLPILSAPWHTHNTDMAFSLFSLPDSMSMVYLSMEFLLFEKLPDRHGGAPGCIEVFQEVWWILGFWAHCHSHGRTFWCSCESRGCQIYHWWMEYNWRMQARHAWSICSFLYSCVISLHSWIGWVCVMLFLKEVRGDMSWKWSNEQGEGSTKGLVVGVGSVIGRGEGIFNDRACRGRHALSRVEEMRGILNKAPPYKHFWIRAWTFELLQDLISKNIILIDPLVLWVWIALPLDKIICVSCQIAESPESSQLHTLPHHPPNPVVVGADSWVHVWVSHDKA